VDKQNYEDAVDADEFNEAFHGIEREFDKLAHILAQGAGGLPAPDWDSGRITLTNNQRWVLLTHNLNSTDLLVDVKMELSQATKDSFKELPDGAFDVLDRTQQWQSGTILEAPMGEFGSEVFVAMYILPNPNQIVLGGFGGNEGRIAEEGLTVRALVWKW
jgi:hypothetical protein